MRIPSSSSLLVLALAPFARPALAQSVPLNPGFEEGAPALVGWRHRPTPQYAVALDSVEPREGRWAARVTGEAGGAANTFGNVLQSTAAAPYRGKRVRYRAWVRTDLPPGASLAALWLRVDRPNQQMGFFDNMRNRPIVGRTGWQAYEIVGDVAPDAQEIYFGMLLVGVGYAWIDQASFEVIGDAAPAARPAPVEPPRPVTERGLENLVAFTRLLGYVRYFHPSDRAAATDWNAFAAAGVRAVEGAPNAARLAAVLDSLFRPVAPTVAVRAGEPRPATADGPRGDSIRWWRHQGVGLSAGQPSAYRSVRVSLPSAAALPDSVPDPRRPLAVRLGGGVSALVPLAVYADGQGTLPRAAAGPAGAAASAPETGDDRATRLADVALGWNVFQHFYPYFDVTEVDWPAELRTALRAAATDTGACAFLVTLRRMVAALDDGHGAVQHGCEGPLGVPPVRVESVEGRPTVTAVAPGVEGVRRGDVVLRVDGLSADSLLRARGELVSSATPQWRRFMTSALLLTGPDSLVRVTVEHGASDTATVRLRRTPGARAPDSRPDPVVQLRPGIWYLDLSRVSTAQLQAALPELERAAGLVFDLRGYPSALDPYVFFSHLIREPAMSARWMVPLVTRPDHVGLGWIARNRWQLSPAAPYLAAPRVFITDGRAISYAESVMGIVEAYRLGEIVGEPTAGTNGNVNPFTLPGGYGVSWTGMQVLKHDGSRHHGVGIHPTVPVPRTRAGVAAGRDEQLERALEVVTRARTP